MKKHLQKFQAALSEGIFAAGLALSFAMLLATSFVRWQQLPNLAEILPAETEAFVIVNIDDYPEITEKISLPINELDWASNHVGLATIDGDLVTIIELSSKRKAKKFMENLLISNYMFKRNFLILAAPGPLAAIQNAQFNLESTAGYQNARGRLPYFSDAYAYVNLESARHKLISFFGNFGIAEPGYLESILQIFPSFGAAINFNSHEWQVESFTAIDKSRINNEGYFRHDSKYKQTLTKWSSGNHAFEWGGHDLTAQLTRTAELLTQLNSSAALVLDSGINETIRKFFGNEFGADSSGLNELSDLLDGEYYFAWTPSDNFLLMLELNDEEDSKAALVLKDEFANNYRFQKTYTTESGEVRAEVLQAEGSNAKYNGAQYFRFEVDNKFVLGLAILNTVAVMSTSEEEFFSALDKIHARQKLRTIHDTGLDANGADEIFVLNLDILPEANILKELLNTFSEIQITRKIFDDGLTTHSSFLLNGDQP